jgi:acetyl esterase
MITPVWPELESIINKGRAVVPLEQMPLAVARATMDRALIRWAGGVPVLCAMRDFHVPGASGSGTRVRIYTPRATARSARPAIVMFHGGGFVLGSIEAQDALAHRVAIGCDSAVISVDYRLAPENPFPAAVNDGMSVYSWVRASADELGIDGGRVGVLGESAGATIAAAVAMTARDQGQLLAGAFLSNPPLSAAMKTNSWQELGADYWLTRDTMTWFWQQYLGPEPRPKSGYAEPLHALSFVGLPPTILISGELDPLRDEITQFHHKLKEAGVAVSYELVPGAIHGFLCMYTVSSRAARLLDQYIAAFASIVRAESGAVGQVTSD